LANRRERWSDGNYMWNTIEQAWYGRTALYPWLHGLLGMTGLRTDPWDDGSFSFS